MAAPQFRRAHYETFAALLGVIADDVIRAELVDADETWRAFREAMIYVFAADNPRFDEAKFRSVVASTLSPPVSPDA